MYRLCYEHLLSHGDPKLIPVDCVSDMSSFRNAVDTLIMLQKNADRIEYVETAYQDYLELKDSLRDYTRINQINLERKARSFFVEFDIFLNRWKRFISKHPRKEEYNNIYKQVTQDAFDHSDDYAIATILRNYAVHFAGIIQGTTWGSTYYNVGFFKYELLKDYSINNTKREILDRQPTDFVQLDPIMEGVLKKLKEIQKALLTFVIDTDVKNAMITVADVIKKIKEYGDKEWFFFDDDGQRLTTTYKDGNAIEYINGKCLECFFWKEFDALIETVSDLCC